MAGLAALDLTARGPCGLGCEAAWGVGASAAPWFSPYKCILLRKVGLPVNHVL